MRSSRPMLTRLLAGLMLAAAWTVAPASAADLTIKVGFPAGGSSDAAARAIARHIGRFLDEKPRVVVQSVPGGASLKLLRQLGRTEPADGSVVGLVSFDHTYLSVLDPDAGEVIGANLVWVGSLSEEPSVCAVHRNSGIETLDAFLSSPFKLGATSRSSQIYAQSAMLKRLLDAPYDIVTGFAGAP